MTKEQDRDQGEPVEVGRWEWKWKWKGKTPEGTPFGWERAKVKITSPEPPTDKKLPLPDCQGELSETKPPQAEEEEVNPDEDWQDFVHKSNPDP